MLNPTAILPIEDVPDHPGPVPHTPRTTRLADADAARSVSVRAAARLHLGFLDPGGTLGRSFGSIGLAIEGFETAVTLSAAAADSFSASDAAQGADAAGALERAAEFIAALRRHSGLVAPLRLTLNRALPSHAGFGSGTQLALAVGRAFASWHRLDWSTPQLAQWLGRGLRSGVGIAAFDHGGLLVDGGPAADAAPAPLLARLPLPPQWRIVLALDRSHRGLAGDAERRALAELPPLPREAAADICHQVLMRVLPGAAQASFSPFAAGITHIQKVLGEHYSPAQGGGAFTSAAVGRFIGRLAQQIPEAAVGQSSWGPTGFAILPSQADADVVLRALRDGGAIDAVLDVRTVRPRNEGAGIHDDQANDAPP